MYTRINDGVKPIVNTGYYISYTTPTEIVTQQFKHYFCGVHSINGAFCPNCQKPLLRFALIDAQDTRLGITDIRVKELPLLFCWTCNLAQGNFFYQCLSHNEIKVLSYISGRESNDFPYKNYPAFFPGSEAYLIAVSELEQDILTQLCPTCKSLIGNKFFEMLVSGF